MKISKLFHWLYATLMFLPLIFFVPSAFYYGLNEHASNTETTTINYKYESNEVNSLNDLVQGNIYQLNSYNLGLTDFLFNETDNILVQLLTPLQIDNSYLQYDETLLSFHEFGCNTILNLYGDNSIYTAFSEEQYINTDYDTAYIYEGVFLNNCIVKLIDYSFGRYQTFSYTDYNEIESVSVNTDDTISNKMYLAWESLWDLPVFSWTKTCFLSAGFTYISGLFGVSATNSLNYVFGYWITISICWLVFDLLIYVPNLAHRWLDKGAVE